MGIDKSRQEGASPAVEDSEVRSHLLRGSRSDFNLGANSSNLSIATEDGGVLKNSQLQ